MSSSPGGLMQPDHSFRPFYVALACLTLFLSGSCWSLGVFTVPVEQHAHPRGVLNGIWPAAMGIGDIIFTPLMILSEMFLDGGRPKPRDVNVPLLSLSTVRIRIISLVVCFVYAVFGISAIGTQRSNSQLIMVPVALRSIASILYYPMANELILAWLPDKPGLAVGLSTFSLELGIMAFSGIFHELIAWLNVVNAIAVSAAFSSVTALFLALTLQWPEEGDVPEEEDADSSDDGSLTLLDTPCGDKKVTWRELFQDYVFWFYLVGVFSTSAAHVFEIYFFKLGSVFGRSTSEVLWLFQVTRVLSMFIGFCGNTWAPSLSGNGRYLFSGAKNVMGSLLGLQALLFACLIPCSIYGNFIAFIMLVAVFDMIASVHSGSLILVAKDLFGKRNITFVFGIGAGLVSCWGEGLSVWLMSILERAATVDDGTSTPSDYNYFYKVGCLWCFSGCLCTFLAVNRCDDQQPREKSFSNGSSKI